MRIKQLIVYFFDTLFLGPKNFIPPKNKVHGHLTSGLRSSTALFTITNFAKLEVGNEIETRENCVIISDSRGQVAGTLSLDRTPEQQTPI